MTGLKKGTGSLDFDEEDEEETSTLSGNAEGKDRTEVDQTNETTMESSAGEESSIDTLNSSNVGMGSQDGDWDMDNLPYLVQRQIRGAKVNADRPVQLLLEVRPFVGDNEREFLDELRSLVDGPVYKGDAREAAMVVAQENPELVAEKLREWGIEYLDK